MNLRGRIKQDMICCIPWRVWKHEIKLLSISAKTLFANRGLPIDKIEMELKDEGFLRLDDVLLEVLKLENNLKIEINLEENTENSNLGEFPENWAEEDFLFYEEQKRLNNER